MYLSLGVSSEDTARSAQISGQGERRGWKPTSGHKETKVIPQGIRVLPPEPELELSPVKTAIVA